MVGGYDYGLFLGYGFRFSFHNFICVGGRTSFGRLDRDNSEENLPDLVPW